MTKWGALYHQGRESKRERERERDSRGEREGEGEREKEREGGEREGISPHAHI